jgi:predicted DNA binding CopG/RHH family protein
MSTPPRTLSEPEIKDMTETESVLMEAVTASAETDLEAAPIHTTIRWSREQLAVIRCAAERYGMPYQTYVKDAAFRRAVEDLRTLEQAKTG